MNIVMLTALFHPHIGGVERHGLRLGEELVKRGHEVTVLTARYDPSLPPEDRIGQVSILRFPLSTRPHTQKPGVWLWMLSRIRILARADHVHIHDHAAFNAWYLPFRFLLPHKPVFATFHGYERLCPVPRRYRVGRKIVERLVRGNICVGHYLEKWYGTKADAVTYGAVDPPRSEVPPEPGTIVFIGRLDPDTGLKTYLKAMPLILEAVQAPMRLILCGDGSLRPWVEKFSSAHAIPVEMAGWVEDPYPWLQRARYVFASGYLTILEAMVHRRPVFAVYENPLKRDYLEMMPGAREMMVIAGSPEELARRFLWILEHRDREAEMLDKALGFAREQTWERLADLYLALWSGRLRP